ncbi:MAG: glycosyltransferase [Paracoccaceae bacterium]
MSAEVLLRDRVAVVVPIYRHSALLIEAIESVLAQEAEFGIVLILVNDGCPFAETEATCLDYARAHPGRVIYLPKPNGGLSDARNRGIRFTLETFSEVEAVYLLDADNRLRPKALARALAALEAHPEAGWVYPNIDMFGQRYAGDYGGPYSRLLHAQMNICEAGSLIRRAVFEAGVVFDTSFRKGFEDWEFFLSAAAAGFTGVNLEDFGFLYRKRPESMLREAEREGAAIRLAMREKHREAFRPATLMRLEHAEAPRFAIYLSDRDEVVLSSDPGQETERLSPEAFSQRIWLSQSDPSRHPSPPFMVVATEAGLEQLEAAKMLHWAFWALEAAADQKGISALLLQPGPEGRVSLSQNDRPEGRQVLANVLMIRTALLRETLQDESAAWINSLASAACQPAIRLLELSLPPQSAPVAGTAVFSFLSMVQRLRASPWRRGAMMQLGWRKGDIAIREAPHLILRRELSDGVAYPRLRDGGRHVGILLPLIEFGGVEKVALNFVRALRSWGFEPHLFVLERSDAAISDEWRALVGSINFLADPAFRAWGGGQGAYLGTEVPGWAQDGAHGRLLGMLHWLDVVISFHGGAAAGVMGQLRRLGIQTVSSLHLSDLSAFGRPVGNTYLSAAYEHAFDYFAPCSHQPADWCHAMGIPQDKIVAVPNAPSFPLPAEIAQASLRQRAGRDPAEPLRVMYLGRLDAQKGLERLAEVMTSAEAPRFDWRVIGGAVMAGAPLPAVVARHVEPVLTSPEELIAAYDWADVLVLLSGYEGLPLTILEAMRQGVVVIATDVGAVSEVLYDGENGVLLPLEGAVRACLSALDRLSRDRALLRRLSERASADMNARDWLEAVRPLAQRLQAGFKSAAQK